MDYSTVLPLCNQLKQKMVQHRRTIHSFAETGFDTFNTTEYIIKQLSSLGIDSYTVCNNAVCADIIGKQGTKAVLLRCDIDALPIKEETNLEFSATNGNMHACGHDFHAAMLLGCAEVLIRLKNEFYGKVTILFQPAEETLSGAKAVLDSGFDIESYDGAVTVHVIAPCKSTIGSIILPEAGINAPSADFFCIEVNGKACHGSSPWLGKNPITPITEIICALNTLASQESDKSKEITITVTSVNSGNSNNVIPEKAQIMGSMRTFDEADRESAKKRVIEISEGISKIFNCLGKVTFTSGCPCLKADKNLTTIMRTVFEKVFGNDNVLSPIESNSLKGSEDFAYFSQRIPSISVAIPAGTECNHNMHSSKVIFNEEALHVGCAVYASFALEILKDN